MRMHAYYFGFMPTGIEMIDRVLSAVACAGKAYHHTESWTEPIAPYENFFRGTTCVQWIQYAAADAASALKAQDGKLTRLVAAAQALDAKLDAMEGPLLSVCGIAQIHSAPYVGPQWTEERQALKAALADAGAGKERGDG